MTALCGVTGTYNQLFLARIGVGIGEAALSPAAYSLITDLFPRHKLGTALGVYNVGVYLGSGLSILLVALILKLINVEGTWNIPFFGDIFPWQSVFFIVGLPGLLIVALIALTVREPERQNGQKAAVPFRDILSYFSANRQAMLCLFFGIAFMAFGSYATTSWTPTLLVRHYGLTESQAGLMLGGIVTIFSTAGVLVGGRYGDRLTKQGRADAKKGRPYDNPYDQPGEEQEHRNYRKGYEQGKQQGVAEEQLEETSPEAIAKIDQITRR